MGGLDGSNFQANTVPKQLFKPTHWSPRTRQLIGFERLSSGEKEEGEREEAGGRVENSKAKCQVDQRPRKSVGIGMIKLDWSRRLQTSDSLSLSLDDFPITEESVLWLPIFSFSPPPPDHSDKSPFPIQRNTNVLDGHYTRVCEAFFF